jgi:electron transfer flavoprotein alpha subunit
MAGVMPRPAALLDVSQISEVTEVLSPDTFKRPIYAGNAIATVQSSEAVKVVTDRATAFTAAELGESAGSVKVTELPMITAEGEPSSVWVGEELSKSERPELGYISHRL